MSFILKGATISLWFVALFSFIFLSGCAPAQNFPLLQASESPSSKIFTQPQKEDLRELFNDLSDAADLDEDCDNIDEALKENKTLYDLEKAYNFRSLFIYEALSDKASSRLEEIAALSVRSFWEEIASSNYAVEDVVSAILECDPDNFSS